MSAIAVVGIAVVCAGVVCLERQQVRRVARRRALARRCRRGGLTLPRSGLETESRKLGSALGHAVFAADVAWSYRHRFERSRGRAESPFRFRRGRVEASIRHYDAALALVRRSAELWLDVHETRGGGDLHRRHVVERLVDFLNAPPRPGETRPEIIDETVDVLENTLASLRSSNRDARDRHPFRH